ncbi:MAG: phosphate ABC transporter ATP-binding protein [Lachnospirales bacterium]
MNNDILSIKQFNLFYGKKQILNSVECSFEKNKITAIIGQSGCGKSSLLKSINRITDEDDGNVSGEIYLKNESIYDIQKEELRKKISMVFQTPVVFPFSVEKNITQVLNYHFSYNKQEIVENTIKYLRMVGLYEDIKDNLKMPANKLSGGEKQRLAIARSLCVTPHVLMLDEPTSALDIKNTVLIEKLLLELKKEYTIIIVTHNLLQARRIADNIIFMDKGKIIEQSECEAFFNNPNSDLSREYLEYI